MTRSSCAVSCLAHPLYKVLRQNGYTYETELLADGTFEILIWR